jgi:cell division septum initiation protein DivIVA
VSGTRDFNLALMGYDRRQVDAFCDEMDEIVGELRGRAADLEQQLEQMQRAKPITAEQAFANVARETQRILQAAQEAGARMLRDSREQAESELALARRERSQIVGDGYRARDEMSEQLRQLDGARARLIRQLQDATAEIDRLAAGLEKGGREGADEASLAARRAERALTGTDEGHRPLGEGERQRAGGRGSLSSGAPLRVIAGADDVRPPRMRVARRETPGRFRPGPGGKVVTDDRDQLGALRVALIERLNDELGAVRDRLRERLRRTSDAGGSTAAVTFDDAEVAAIAEEGAVQLRQAFDLGASAAAAERDGLQPATGGEDVHATLAAVLDEGVGAPIRELLAEGDRADDPPWVLVERIDGIVSDVSAAMVSLIAETELSRAYERGKLATWSDGDVAARRWIVSQRGHRSDETCRSNADAGAVPVAAPFPSGEHTPPRRDGCTCTTVAADEESDP